MKELKRNDIDKLIPFGQLLNPDFEEQLIRQRFNDIFNHDNYHCFGYYYNETLIAIMGGWLTTRLYSGQQLEVDNFMVLPDHRSTGIGSKFLTEVENWAKNKGCLSVELNAYASNLAGHRFYTRNGYKQPGVHFIKKL